MEAEHHIDVYLRGTRVISSAVPVEGLSIGREISCGLVLASPLVSKLHGNVVTGQDALHFTDARSSQGTFHRGQRVESARLVDGDELQIGPYTLRARIGRQVGQDDARPTGQQAPLAAVEALLQVASLVGVRDERALLEALLARTSALIQARSGFVVLVRDGQMSPVLAHHGKGDHGDDGFSRTACERAVATGRAVVLAGPSDFAQLGDAPSLGARDSRLVLALPLLHDGTTLGVLYLESPHLLVQSLALEARLLAQLSALGGRALAVAVEHAHLTAAGERWRWLAREAVEPVDVDATSRSPAMLSVLSILRRAAVEDVNVLVTGESGTGKEVAAQAIHRLSRHAAGPFVALNCGAIPRELMEAELFGHEKGAFTGAIARRPGRLELAQDGTLLLDEVGELPRDLQVKLLRVLETRRFERVGGTASLAWNARVIAATNRDLAKEVAAGRFRDDLYFRLDVVGLHLPPLRARREDIEPLALEVLTAANRRFQRKLYGFSADALAALTSYSWPGNIRELRNVVERAFVLETSDVLTAASLVLKGPAAATTPLPVGDHPSTLFEFLAAREREFICLVLDRHGGNVTRSAEVLGISRQVLHRKIRAMGTRS